MGIQCAFSVLVYSYCDNSTGTRISSAHSAASPRHLRNEHWHSHRVSSTHTNFHLNNRRCGVFSECYRRALFFSGMAGRGDDQIRCLPTPSTRPPSSLYPGQVAVANYNVSCVSAVYTKSAPEYFVSRVDRDLVGWIGWTDRR